MTPLSYDPLDCASGFEYEMCKEGIVGMSGDIMKIIALDELGEMFNQQVVPLRYTPRKMVINPENNNLIIIESSHRSFN